MDAFLKTRRIMKKSNLNISLPGATKEIEELSQQTKDIQGQKLSPVKPSVR